MLHSCGKPIKKVLVKDHFLESEYVMSHDCNFEFVETRLLNPIPMECKYCYKPYQKADSEYIVNMYCLHCHKYEPDLDVPQLAFCANCDKMLTREQKQWFWEKTQVDSELYETV